MKDALALAAFAVWIAIYIGLWIVRPPQLQLLAYSLLMGVVFFAGFFGYLAYRNRDKSGD